MSETIKKLRVMIADDNTHVRNSLKNLIELEESIEICCEADSVNEAARLLDMYRPEILLVDISFEGKIAGIDFIKKARARYHDIKIIVLSMHDKAALVRASLEAGGDFFLSKEYAPEKIIEIIKSKQESLL